MAKKCFAFLTSPQASISPGRDAQDKIDTVFTDNI
ncbi:hypothetical protein SHVI106290_03280 [Shewanella violacea]